MSTIVDVIVADKNLATMLRNLKAAGLETELCKEGPYTLFAPTDLAFGKIAAGEITEMLKPENKVKLSEMLNDHVIEGRAHYRDLKDGQKLKTLNGKQLDVKVTDGKVTINGASVQGRDSEASNGVVHSLDTVIQVQ